MTILFTSSAKGYLKKEIKKRNAKARIINGNASKGSDGKLSRSVSSDSLTSRAPVIGITQNLEREFDDVMSEIRAFKAKKKK